MNARMKGFWIKPLAALAVACAACTASADLFYWMVDEAKFNPSGKDAEFSYATVSTDNGATYLNVYNQSGDTGYWKLYTTEAASRSTSPAYSGSFDSSLISSLYVQLWDSSGTEVGWQRFEIADVMGSVWTGATAETPSGGATVWRVTSVVPEPTSALLVLFGLVGLALRRKKELMTAGCALALAVAANAAANDALISFSTPGIDTYADGTTVLDGECYALVWTAKGASFALAADGTAEGGEIVLVAPVAKGGRCPKIVFEIDADDLSGKYTGGSWSVYLLDTRRYGADGVSLAPLKDGRPTTINATINASAEVAGATISVGSGAPREVAVDAGTQAGVAASLPAGFDQRPTIADIQLDGGLVYVTVENTVSYLAYDLSSGDTPEAVTERVNDPRHGGDDGMVILVAPAKEGGAFFKVGLN